MKDTVINFLNHLPKYSITIIIDVSLIVISLFVLMLLVIVYFVGKYIKQTLFDDDDVGEIVESSADSGSKRIHIPTSSESSHLQATSPDTITTATATINSTTNMTEASPTNRNNLTVEENASPSVTTTGGKPSFRRLDPNTVGTEKDGNTPSTHKSIPKMKSSILHSASVDTATNTVYDLEEFMTRLYKSFFIIYRLKDENHGQINQKKRLMKLNQSGELIFYKTFHEKVNNRIILHDNVSVQSTVTPSSNLTVGSTYSAVGSPYIVLPLNELINCIECDEENLSKKPASSSSSPTPSPHNSFLLEFQHKILHLKCPLAIDNNYLLKGFQQLIHRMKQDRQYLENWKSQTRYNNGNENASRSTPNAPPRRIDIGLTPEKSNPLRTTGGSAGRGSGGRGRGGGAVAGNSNRNDNRGDLSSQGKGTSDDDLDFGTVYSYNTSTDHIMEDVDTRLARKRLSDRNSKTEPTTTVKSSQYY